MLLYFLLLTLSAYNVRSTPATFGLSTDEPLNPEPSKNQLKRTLFSISWSCLSTTILCAWTTVHPNVPPRCKWRARWKRLTLMFWMIVAPELVLAWAVRQYFAAKDIRDAYNERKGVKEWTLCHGHLLVMGGYTLVSNPEGKGKLLEPRKPGWLATAKDWESYYELEKDYRRRQLGTLTVDRFKDLLEDSNFEFPDITEADIQDRSKGDTLFKLITFLQTAWFILQCAARKPQQLALTELELITLALASLNGFTFAIWLRKPLGVQEPIRIYLKTEAPQTEVLVAVQVNGVDPLFSFNFARVFLSNHWRFVSRVPSMIVRDCRIGTGRYWKFVTCYVFFALGPFIVAYTITYPLFLLVCVVFIFIFRVLNRGLEPVPPQVSQGRSLLATRFLLMLYWLRRGLSLNVEMIVGKELHDIDNVSNILFFIPSILSSGPIMITLIAAIPLGAILFLASFIFTAVFGIVTTTYIRPGASHVPSFYAPSTKSDRWSRMVVFALFGVFFGGLHCLGWYFTFPSHSEQTLWRGMSSAITAIPLVVAPIDFLLANRLQNRDLNSYGLVERISLLFLDLIMTILLFVYVPIRLSLIVQALTLLRNQPPSALVAVDWTKYIPHLFS